MTRHRCSEPECWPCGSPRCWACGASAGECPDSARCEEDTRRMEAAYAEELAAEDELLQRGQETMG